jgi:hypothetical protein
MELSFNPADARQIDDPFWQQGWAISHYSLNGVSTPISNQIYVCKYYAGGYTMADRVGAGEKLLRLTKLFISTYWPTETRPFDAVVVPPQNFDKEFNLTTYIAARLTSGGIWDYSNCLSKTREINSMKNVALERRSSEMDKALKFEIGEEIRRPKGILVFDDILGTGSTAKEVSRAIKAALPQMPLYYLSLTYIKGQAIK